MKSASHIAALAALSSIATAFPFQKRDAVTVVKTSVVYTTVDVVKTVYVDQGSAAATHAPQAQPQAISAAPAAPKPKPSKAPKPVAGPAQAVQPSMVTAHAPIPKPSKPASSKAPKPAPSSGSSGSSASAQTNSGDGTHYDVGLGSCGWTSTPDQFVVALSYLTMNNGANPNTNPLCGQQISISYGGVTETATIVDTCMGCQGAGDVDMSDSLFEAFAPLDEGRIYGVQWDYV